MLKKVPTIYRMLMIVCIFSFSTVYGQDMASMKGKVKLSQASQDKNLQPLQHVIREIESKYQIFLNYPDEIIQDKTVNFGNINFSNSLEQVLKDVLVPLDLQFEHLDKNYYLITRRPSPKKIERLDNTLDEQADQTSEARSTGSNLQTVGKLFNLLSQERSVSGQVVSGEDSSPIPGVNVIVKNTTQGTVTDADGNYNLTVPQDGGTLVFSYVGFETQEVQIGGRSVIDITLSPDIEELSEIVVVGYGTQERARVTGAMSSISAEEINELPVASLDAAMQGRATGVTVTNSGGPGANPLVQIRGVGTVGDNSPLYVIDGMPSDGLNSINPNDIESIQVLKDASAAAIYGSRAANGVILVTTKKGQQGQARVSLDAYYGTQAAWKQLDLLNTEQYLAFGKDLIDNGTRIGDTPSYPGAWDNVNPNQNTDWQDEMFRTAPIQDYNINVSGGSDNALFSVSGGYFNQEGIMLGTGFERYSFRANSEFTLGKFRFGETLTIAHSDRQNQPFNGGRSQIEHMIKSLPYMPVRDENRLGGFRGPDNADGSDPENPVLLATLFDDMTQSTRLLGTAYGAIELFEGLEYKLMVGVDIENRLEKNFIPIYNAGSFHSNTTTDVEEDRIQYVSPLVSNQLTYDRSFGSHNLNVVGVFERQTHTLQNTLGRGETNLTDQLDVLNGLSGPSIDGGRSEYALLSYIGRVNYDYAGKYLFSASVRRDGGSRFSPDQKWGTFPSVSLGWRISEEPFMANLPAVSDLKIRGSWGKVGNDKIGDYAYQSTVNGNMFYVFNSQNVPAYSINALANSDIIWETTVMTNFGLDLGLFNDRLLLSAEYFDNETQDMLLEVPLPFSSGFDVAPVANVGTVTNSGLEFALGYRKMNGPFTWSVDANVTTISNEVKSLGSGNTIAGPPYDASSTDPVTFTEEGQPVGYFYGWQVDGIFQNLDEIYASGTPTHNIPENRAEHDPAVHTSPGDIRFKDVNGNGVIDAGDRTNLGHYLPDFSYGLNFSAGFGGFDVRLFLQGVSGNKVLNQMGFDVEGMTRLFNSGTRVLDRWQQEGDQTDVPRAVNADPNRNARISDRFVEDGSYMRIKNLTVGYNLPETLLQNFGGGFIRNLRVYISSQNLLTFTNYSGYDPEIGAQFDENAIDADDFAQRRTLSQGVDFGQFPQPRTFLGGIQIDF